MPNKISRPIFRWKCPHNDVLVVGQNACRCFWCHGEMERTYLGEVTIGIEDNHLVAEITNDRVSEPGQEE